MVWTHPLKSERWNMNRSMMIAATTLLLLFASAALCQDPPSGDEARALAAIKAREAAAKAELEPFPKADVPPTRFVVDQTWNRKVGDVASIFSPSSPSVYVGLDTYGSYYDMLKVLKAQDTVGLGRMIEQKRVASIPRGTKALLIEISRSGLRDDEPTMMVIRIREGEFKDQVAILPEMWFARVAEVPIRPAAAAKAKAKVKAKPLPKGKPAPADPLSPAGSEARAARALAPAMDLEKAGQSDRALEAYRAIVRDDPAAPSAARAKARIDALTGRPRK